LADDARLNDFVARITPTPEAATPHQRRQLKLEIDAAVALAYGLSEAEMSGIIETMPRDFDEHDKTYVLKKLAGL
jgi:hypothetical protein